MGTLAQALAQARTALAHLEAGRLEAEVLLAYVVGKPRSHLHAWPEAPLAGAQQGLFEQLVARRAAGEPLAYLTGRREFWSLDLEVSPVTLIPRPETELLVEHALRLLTAQAPLRIADLGTGSGAVAIALARERPHWQVWASDRSAGALAVARRNARRLAVANLAFVRGDWLAAFAAASLDAIVSNPPYVAEADPHLLMTELRYEPRAALAAGPRGLDALARLIADAARVLKPGGWIFLEHAPAQSRAVQSLMTDAGLCALATLPDLAGMERVTRGRVPA